jgi:hypothetical protein
LVWPVTTFLSVAESRRDCIPFSVQRTVLAHRRLHPSSNVLHVVRRILNRAAVIAGVGDPQGAGLGGVGMKPA